MGYCPILHTKGPNPQEILCMNNADQDLYEKSYIAL